MFKELKKRSFQNSLIGTILFLLIGLLLSFSRYEDAYYAVTGYVQFEQLMPEEIKSQSVNLEMSSNFGCFMEESQKTFFFSRPKVTDLYYVIWTGDDYATDYRYMAIKVPVSMQEEMDAMADNSYQELLSDPISISGKICKLDHDDYAYFEDFFLRSGWSDEEIKAGTLPYYIDTYRNVTGNNIFY